MKTVAKKYKEGTDPRVDALLPYHPEAVLWVVEGRYGKRAVWLDRGRRNSNRLEAVKEYFRQFGGGGSDSV